MSDIKIERPTQAQLESMGVFAWPIWEKEASTFPWSYDEQETCYLLEGEVKVTPEGADPVAFGAGDLVVFPQGMHCTWEISRAVRKHYKFG